MTALRKPQSASRMRRARQLDGTGHSGFKFPSLMIAWYLAMSVRTNDEN
jgi:hypothetical protein